MGPRKAPGAYRPTPKCDRGRGERQRAGGYHPGGTGAVRPLPKRRPPISEPMSVTRIVATAIVLLISSRSAAAGQTIPSPYRFFETRQELSAFGGQISPGTGRFGYGPGPGQMVGVRYGLELSGPLSVEGVASWIPTTRDVVDPSGFVGARTVGSADVQLFAADVRFKLSLTGQRVWHNLNPFLFAGAGMARDFAQADPADLDLDEDDRFEFGAAFMSVLGGGLRWFVKDPWIVRADGGLHLWKLDAPIGFRLVDRGFGDVGSSEWVSAPSISISLGYRF